MCAPGPILSLSKGGDRGGFEAAQERRSLLSSASARPRRLPIILGLGDSVTVENVLEKNMHRPHTAIACLTAALFTLPCTGNSMVAEERPTPGKFLAFKHNRVERKYLLHLPKDLPDNAPLVFLLHGYHGDARDYMGELGMNRVADANRFAVCYPQGAEDHEGTPHWNARLSISKTEDIGFLSDLAAYLQVRHKLNPNKTFVSGISNGGFMSYTLVAERPSVFKAAASVIGTMSGHTWKHRAKIRPVPILQISGLDDEIIPYDGSMSPAGGWGGAPTRT